MDANSLKGCWKWQEQPFRLQALRQKRSSPVFYQLERAGYDLTYINTKQPEWQRAVSRRRGNTSNRIDLSRIPEDDWQIDFSSGTPVFTRFTREKAAERISELGQILQLAHVVLGEHIDWGDLLRPSRRE